MASVTASSRKRKVETDLVGKANEVLEKIEEFRQVATQIEQDENSILKQIQLLFEIERKSKLIKMRAQLIRNEDMVDRATDFLDFTKKTLLSINPTTEKEQSEKDKLMKYLESVPTPPKTPPSSTSVTTEPKTVKSKKKLQFSDATGTEELKGESATLTEIASESAPPSVSETVPAPASAAAAAAPASPSSPSVAEPKTSSVRVRGYQGRRSQGSSAGMDVKRENAPGPTVALNANLPPDQAQQNEQVVEPVPNPQPEPQPVPQSITQKPTSEQESKVGLATTESTRQNELSEVESATLQYKPNFTEVLDASFMRLATDAVRGNLGAGTTADMQSADLWGNQFTQPPSDIPVAPEKFLTTGPSGLTVEDSSTSDKTQNVYSFLPFAKLGGDLVWIPRHVKAARLFFTAEDYAELVSHIRDGDPLTLDKTDEVDTLIMMSTIIRTYGTLKQFCELGSMLPTTASVEQVYAEWLEMRQIGTAVARYEQITGGMYENTELSMKGGIRAAVASALRPFVEAWNQMHKNDQIAMDGGATAPGSGPMFSGKRKAEAGIVEPEEYNPQFNFEPVEFKRIKFSIPSI